MKKLMYCKECKIETVHASTENGWVCWCGNETDAQEASAREWANGVNELTVQEMEAVHFYIFAAETDDYLGTHFGIVGGEVLELDGHSSSSERNGGDDLPL